MSELKTVLEYLPMSIKKNIENFICNNNIEVNVGQGKIISESTFNSAIEEIRLRTNKPISLKIGQDTIMLEYIVKQQEILQTF